MEKKTKAIVVWVTPSFKKRVEQAAARCEESQSTFIRKSVAARLGAKEMFL